MSDIKNLTDKKAVSKLKDMAENIRICLFCTDLTRLPLNTRPMGVQEVDDEGNIWFISSKRSNKNFDIVHDDRVQLFFSKTGDSEYLSVYGKATIYKDREKIEELWNPIAKAWFEEGKDDPDVTVIKVAPEDVYYWDSKYGKIITLITIAAAAVTGKENNAAAVEGHIKI